MNDPSEFLLLRKFEETFRDRRYIHRNSQLGNRIADFLFDDLYLLREDSRFRADIDAREVALNPKGVSPGLRARRGDGSLGPVVPGHQPRAYSGHVVPIAPTAEVDIGAEVKMIKQIDRVIIDLCGQAQHFKTKSPRAIPVGIVGLNLADHYVSFERDRSYATDGRGAPHPAQEAHEAERRLHDRAESCFTEFIVLPFRATNESPYPFEWATPRVTRDDYASMLVRLLRSYERR